MRFEFIGPSVLALIWAGVSLGGALVAAPAKFTAPSLEMSVALDVGRAQFKWLGYTEGVIFVFLIIALLFAWRDLNWKLFMIPIVVFLIQQIGIMPKLDALTLKTIEGVSHNSGSLHIVYVILECTKFISLIVASIVGLKSLT